MSEMTEEEKLKLWKQIKKCQRDAKIGKAIPIIGIAVLLILGIIKNFI